MERKRHLLLICFLTALALALGASTAVYWTRSARQARALESVSQRSLSQLLSSLSSMETLLEKTRYAGSGPLRSLLAAQLWNESQLAAAAFGALPLGDEPPEQLETFLAQTGDYAYYLLRASAYDRGDEGEWETLSALADNARTLTQSVRRLKAQVDTGQAGFRALGARSGQVDGVSQGLLGAQEDFPEYPSLIYDGPYSDHVSQRTALGLEGCQELSREELLRKARALLGEGAEYAYDGGGAAAYAAFTLGDKIACFTRAGGFLLSFTDGRETGERTLSPEEGVQKALDYVRALGLPQMAESYYTLYETILTVNLAVQENGATAYPDLVKVGVALDDGSIVRFDALGYLMNHHDRGVPSPAVSLETARAQLPEGMEETGAHLAYIPTAGQNEVLCWELVCRDGSGQQALYFYNAESGALEELLLLIQSEEGFLTR